MYGIAAEIVEYQHFFIEIGLIKLRDNVHFTLSDFM